LFYFSHRRGWVFNENSKLKAVQVKIRIFSSWNTISVIYGNCHAGGLYSSSPYLVDRLHPPQHGKTYLLTKDSAWAHLALKLLGPHYQIGAVNSRY